MSSQWAMFIVTVVLVLITAWYARETARMAKRMKQQTDALIAPHVNLRAELRDRLVFLVVSNDGASAACDLHLTSDRSVPTKDWGVRQPLEADRLFSPQGIHLAPGETKDVALGSEEWVAGESYNTYAVPFTVSATYSWPGGGSITQDTPIRVLDLWSTAELDNLCRAPMLRNSR